MRVNASGTKGCSAVPPWLACQKADSLIPRYRRDTPCVTCFVSSPHRTPRKVPHHFPWYLAARRTVLLTSGKMPCKQNSTSEYLLWRKSGCVLALFNVIHHFIQPKRICQDGCAFHAWPPSRNSGIRTGTAERLSRNGNYDFSVKKHIFFKYFYSSPSI